MKLLRNISIWIMAVAIVACSPKTSAPVVEEALVKEEPKVQESALTPCTTLSQLSASDREEAETAFVLYRDHFKRNEYQKALPLWRKAYTLAPGANGKIQYHYNDGVKLYTKFYQEATEDAQKKAYMDTVMMIYDKRVECFGDEARNNGRKAFDRYYNFYAHSDLDGTFDLFKKSVMAKGEKADYFIINPFSKLLYDYVVQEKISKEEGAQLANTLASAIKYGNANCGNKCEAWDIISAYAPNRLEALEGVDDFYDCEYYASKYYQAFLDNPTDCETIELAYRRMLRGKCSADDARLAEVKAAKDNNCYTPPPPAGPLKQAYTAYTNGDYKGAVALFESFVNKTQDTEKKAKYTLLIAKIYYGDIKDFAKSRFYAKKAADYKPNWGDPYILIGKLYASSGPLCGPGRGWDSQIVTWPAIDKFRYAKKIDPSVAAEANKWIATYSKYMPSREDIFQRSIKEGSAFKVGCWINENTTVRVAK